MLSKVLCSSLLHYCTSSWLFLCLDAERVRTLEALKFVTSLNAGGDTAELGLSSASAAALGSRRVWRLVLVQGPTCAYHSSVN